MVGKQDPTEYYNARWRDENLSDRAPNQLGVDVISGRVVEATRGTSNPSILDVGCGNGWILKAIDDVHRGAHGFIESNRRLWEWPIREIVVPRAFIYEGYFGSDSFAERFDVIVCSEVIEHVSHKSEFLAAVSLHLKPGGHLILSTPNGRYRKSYFKNTGGPPPQPVEIWASCSELKLLSAQRFQMSKYRRLDISYWNFLNSRAASLLTSLWAVSGGYRASKLIEKLLLKNAGVGLYLLAEGQKPVR